MTQVTMLSASQISHLLDMPAVIDAVADAYKEKANHPATLWPMVYEQLGGEADMDIRSGVLASKHVFGNKLLAWFGENAKRGLPELNGLVNLYNSDTGEPAAVLNATALTGFRTGTAGAVASRLLANPDATTLLVVGTGRSQAPYQIMAQLCVLPKVTQVLLANPRDAKKAQAAAAQMPRRSTMKIKDFGVEQWMNEYETKAKYNLGETCVSSLSIREFCELVGVDVNDFAKQLVDRRLTYGAIEGAVELKEAITRLYQNLTPDEIVTEHGAIGANNLVLNALVEPGDEVIAVTPTYQQLQSIPKAIGAMVKLLPLKRENGYLPDAEQLRGLVSDKTKLIVLNNPDNPTGALMSQAGLQTIVDIAKSVDAYVLCDEVYRQLTQEDGYSPSIIDLYDKGISTSSFSKVFSLAGIRLGWLATHDQAVMKACLSYRDYETISCGQLDEMVGTLALKNQAVLLERNRGIVRENLKVLEEWVHQQPHITWLKPKAGTTALLYYDFDLPSTIFCDRLMKEYETLLVPGSCFDIENSLRIGYAFETTHLRDGMNQLGKFLAKLEQEAR